MSDIVQDLQSITNSSRIRQEKAIYEALQEVKWDSIYSSSIESAKQSAEQGRSSVEITLTPYQRVGCFNEEPTHEWTAAKAYRDAFDKQNRELFTKMGFSVLTTVQPNWHGHTFLYRCTLSWSKDTSGDLPIPSEKGKIKVPTLSACGLHKEL